MQLFCYPVFLTDSVLEVHFRFCERAQALIHGDLHTGSVMVTHDSTQVIDPEFAYYGPMGFDVGAFLGNLILAFFSQDGHAKEGNDRKVSLLVSSCIFLMECLYLMFAIVLFVLLCARNKLFEKF